MSETVTITGDRAVAQRLLDIGSKSKLKSASNRALGAGAKVVNRQARINVRQRVKRRTGRLATGIETTRLRVTRQGNFVRRVRFKDRAYFAPGEYYPPFVEYGHGNVAGRHALRDAYSQTKTETAGAIEAELADYANKQGS